MAFGGAAWINDGAAGPYVLAAGVAVLAVGAGMLINSLRE